MRRSPRRLLHAALVGCGVAGAVAAADPDGPREALIAAINDYRASSHACNGAQTAAASPLAPNDRLAGLPLGADASIQRTLGQRGYQAARLQAISIGGPASADAALRFIAQRHCDALSDAALTEIGVSRQGQRWLVVLAQPLLSPDLPDWRAAGEAVLRLANQARAEPRRCGDESFAAAPPLAWNDSLATAALAHSRDMAAQQRFAHRGSDGSQVDDRVSRTGYHWRRVGENIAGGQGSAAKVMSAWLSSPHHCANLMNPRFREIGTAYAINRSSDTVIYWTQVFASPR